ncbi:hypothetical protein [Streptomyces sp. NPDC059787]|uniref:hypothetical protein n=1 Tax=Streptomyces sp. NPDC059787 TaxID=3346947 RepID=UPI0036639C3D
MVRPLRRAQPTWLVLRHPGTDDEMGRSLLLLDAVTARWGVTQNARGKTVWCELPDGSGSPL